jgi:hypothetical protein
MPNNQTAGQSNKMQLSGNGENPLGNTSGEGGAPVGQQRKDVIDPPRLNGGLVSDDEAATQQKDVIDPPR